MFIFRVATQFDYGPIFCLEYSHWEQLQMIKKSETRRLASKWNKFEYIHTVSSNANSNLEPKSIILFSFFSQWWDGIPIILQLTNISGGFRFYYSKYILMFFFSFFWNTFSSIFIATLMHFIQKKICLFNCNSIVLKMEIFRKLFSTKFQSIWPYQCFSFSFSPDVKLSGKKKTQKRNNRSNLRENDLLIFWYDVRPE